jgi:hypothetical protein
MTTCTHGHSIRSQADRTAQGFCRQCKRLDDARRRRRDREDVELVRALEALTPQELAARLAAVC